MHRYTIISTLILLLAAPAWASSISVISITDNSNCNDSCFVNGGHDWGMSRNSSAGAAGTIPFNTIGSASTSFDINANAAIDGGGDRTINHDVDFTATLQIVVDHPQYEWNVDLLQSALGLYAFRGDGTASAVGDQQDGSVSASNIIVNVGGFNYNVNVTGNSWSVDCSNTCQTSQQFSGNRNDNGIISGTGSQNIAVSISFDLSAFTNDGCNGSVCSSISGGEESGVLFGASGGMDQAVDDYGTWGRSLAPDGLNQTFTLNVTSVPEPGTAVLVCLGLAVMARSQRKR